MTNNPHIMEERKVNNVEDSGINEEEKYVAHLTLSLMAATYRMLSGMARSSVVRMPMFLREREKLFPLLPPPHLRRVVLTLRDARFPKCPLTLQMVPVFPNPTHPLQPRRLKHPLPLLRPRR